MNSITKIDMTYFCLDQLVQQIPRMKGKYVLYLNPNVSHEARRYFEYDKQRVPQHQHFLAYKKNFFDIDYIGHYLFHTVETFVRYDYESPNIIMSYEIKEGWKTQ